MKLRFLRSRVLLYAALLLCVVMGARYVFLQNQAVTAPRAPPVDSALAPPRAGDDLVANSNSTPKSVVETGESLNHSTDSIVAPSIAPQVPKLARRRRALDQGLEEFSAQIGDLRRKAKDGDLAAMKALYGGLHLCIGAPRDQEDLDERLASISIDYGKDGNAEAANSARAFQSRLQRLCAPAGPDRDAELFHWLRMAAETGDSAAKLDFVMLGAPHPQMKRGAAVQTEHYRLLGKKFLAEELAAKNPSALLIASMSFTENGLFPPDSQNEYAYLYAYTLAKPGIDHSYFISLEALKNRMSDAMLSAAVTRGELLYRECCSK